MNLPSHADLKPRRHRWRRMLLLILNTRPQGWARATRWAAVAGAMLLTVLFTNAPGPYEFNGEAWYVQQPDGSWAYNRTSLESVNTLRIQYRYTVAEGIGWRTIQVYPVSVSNDAGPVPPNGMTQPQLDAAVRETLLNDSRDFEPMPPETALRARALRLILDGRTFAGEGRFYMPRLVWNYTGWVVLFAAAIVGSLRQLQRWGYAQRLEAFAEYHCPSCGYPLTGIPSIRCPECGLDLHRDQAESRREIGE